MHSILALWHAAIECTVTVRHSLCISERTFLWPCTVRSIPGSRHRHQIQPLDWKKLITGILVPQHIVLSQLVPQY